MTVRLIHGFTTDPVVGPYVRGKLTLAGLDTRVDADSYLDAVYATVAEAPGEVLDKMMRKIVEVRARVAPNRDTWGLEPEHRAMSSGLMPDTEDEAVTGGPVTRRGRGSADGKRDQNGRSDPRRDQGGRTGRGR